MRAVRAASARTAHCWIHPLAIAERRGDAQSLRASCESRRSGALLDLRVNVEATRSDVDGGALLGPKPIRRARCREVHSIACRRIVEATHEGCAGGQMGFYVSNAHVGSLAR